MKLKTANTEINIYIRETDDTVGLKDGDCWCEVDLHVLNDEIDYSICRKPLSRIEFLGCISSMRKFLNNEKVQNMQFIKNYFALNFFQEENKMELKLTSMIGIDKKIYSVLFYDDEIKQFCNLISKNTNVKVEE